MFDLKDFSSNPEERTRIDSDGSSLASNGFIRIMLDFFKSTIKYKTTVLIILCLGTIFGLAITGDFKGSVNDAREFSEVGARENVGGIIDFFIKKTGHRSLLINSHPFYNTKKAKLLEAKFLAAYGYEINLKKMFAYAEYNGQDWIVMKGAAIGKNRDKLSLEYSTVLSMDAEDYCQKYFDGYVPNDEMIKHFVGKYNIWKIKNEVSEDNDGPGEFRCVIDPDTIEDYISSNME